MNPMPRQPKGTVAFSPTMQTWHPRKSGRFFCFGQFFFQPLRQMPSDSRDLFFHNLNGESEDNRFRAWLLLWRNNPANSDDPSDNIFLPPDRRTLQKLSQAKELIAKGRYGEAVENLGAILEGPEDYFFQPQINKPLHRSLKAEAQHLIGQMPREGRELYELEFGAKAKRLLEEAVAAGDAQSLAEVSRRFFHTRAGYEATFLLGLDHLDRGRPLAGALTLQRLADAAEASDQFEPALSLAMATGWLQSGAPDKARGASDFSPKSSPTRHESGRRESYFTEQWQ